MDEQDEAGNLTATYVESSTDETGNNSRIDIIVGAQSLLQGPFCYYSNKLYVDPKSHEKRISEYPESFLAGGLPA